MHMAVSHFNGFSGDCAEAMIVTFVTLIEVGSAAYYFMHMLLLVTGGVGLSLSFIRAAVAVIGGALPRSAGTVLFIARIV